MPDYPKRSHGLSIRGKQTVCVCITTEQHCNNSLSPGNTYNIFFNYFKYIYFFLLFTQAVIISTELIVSYKKHCKSSLINMCPVIKGKHTMISPLE